jgi:hypothetical protein
MEYLKNPTSLLKDGTQKAHPVPQPWLSVVMGPSYNLSRVPIFSSPAGGSFPRTPGGLGRPFLPGLLGGNIQNRCTGSARAMTGHSIAPLVCQSWRMRITLSIVLLLTLASSAQAQRLRVLPPEEYDRPYTEGPIITIPARDQVHVRELCPNRSLTSA